MSEVFQALEPGSIPGWGTKMKIFSWVLGEKKLLEHTGNLGGATVQINLEDDRTVQIDVREDGTVFLRGWGNTPDRLGNVNKMEFHGKLEKEEPNTCIRCWKRFDYCKCAVDSRDW